MSFLESLWWAQRPGPGSRLLRALLAPAAVLFRSAVALRALLYRTGLAAAARPQVPTVSIGNVAVGGAGKTPVAAAVAARLAARGRRVAILSRGYGARRAEPRVVSDGAQVLLGAEDAGDEPHLLARRLPGIAVLCAPHRTALLPMAAALGADVLVLDDAFQHRALARDLDVVVLDAANPFGNGRLLPAGPNREPRSALRRAGLVWLSRADQAEASALQWLRALAREATGSRPVESRHAPVEVLDGTLAHSLGLDALHGRVVVLLSGIARPAAFRRTVESLGAQVIAERTFPDHHVFDEAELEAVLALAGPGAAAEAVVTTEKDAVRLPSDRARDERLRVVRIEAEILDGAEELDAALDRLLSSPRFTSAALPTGAP